MLLMNFPSISDLPWLKHYSALSSFSYLHFYSTLHLLLFVFLCILFIPMKHCDFCVESWIIIAWHYLTIVSQSVSLVYFLVRNQRPNCKATSYIFQIIPTPFQAPIGTGVFQQSFYSLFTLRERVCLHTRTRGWCAESPLLLRQWPLHEPGTESVSGGPSATNSLRHLLNELREAAPH